VITCWRPGGCTPSVSGQLAIQTGEHAIMRTLQTRINKVTSAVHVVFISTRGNKFEHRLAPAMQSSFGECVPSICSRTLSFLVIFHRRTTEGSCFRHLQQLFPYIEQALAPASSTKRSTPNWLILQIMHPFFRADRRMSLKPPGSLAPEGSLYMWLREFPSQRSVILGPK